LYTRAHRRKPSQEVVVAGKAKFTRIPKVADLIAAGIPAEVIPTYCALADYANNKNGLCWPKMESLAKTLNRSVRTIQRHLHLLKKKGMIEFVERRRQRGRYSSYLYRVLHIVSTTTGHGRRVGGGAPIYRRTKRSVTPPYSPPKEAFNWLFGKERNPKAEEEHKNQQEQRRRQEAEQRKRGYGWLFE
jgi:DNA-binding transcriptional ArsR family regulator